MSEEGTKNESEAVRWRGWRVWRFRLFILAALLLVGALSWVGLSAGGALRPTPVDPTIEAILTAAARTVTPSATASPLIPTDTPSPAPTRAAPLGTLIYAARARGRSHLWAVSPRSGIPVQLTGGDWDDRDPAVSPDGTQVLFRSNRSGNWDLYLLDLRSGGVRQVTETPGFEGHPAWSPDGRWIVFEGYYDGDLDLFIIPVDGEGDSIQLTNHPGADMEPHWSPDGRRIAFISERDGSPDVFIADLDDPGHRFHNVTRTSGVIEHTPRFDPDGTALAYSARADGLEMIWVLPLEGEDQAPREVGQGVVPVWGPGGERLAAVLKAPTTQHLVVYDIFDEGGAAIGLEIPGRAQFVDWTVHGLPGEVYQDARRIPSLTPAYSATLGEPLGMEGRISLVALPGVTAPNAQLSDAVDEAFLALRSRLARELGWDFLASLEQAFVGLNDPLPPGYAFNDWLYSGRAFAFSQAAVRAGWVEVVREDFGGQVYWRVFVRTSEQGGGLGEPLRDRPWDFEARFQADPVAYDQGGAIKESIPQGYYVDLTELAADFGFERLPALSNWRTFYLGARFNEFVRTDGLNWQEAMLQLYPPEAIVTLTPFSTPTPTPTRTPRPTATPWWWRWRTPTPRPTQTPTQTPSPTVAWQE